MMGAMRHFLPVTDAGRNSEVGSGLNEDEVRRRHILLKALVVGLVAGAIASVFRLCLAWAEDLRIGKLSALPREWSLVGWIGTGILTGAAAVWLVRRFSPEASGSGIPHLQAVLLGQRKLDWKRLLPVKFIAGVVGIGGGMALGREGPTIQMGGSAGLMVADWFRVKVGGGERRALISAGAGAGLAAAFNSPLAGMIFVLEELQGKFTPVVFVAAFLASITANIVGRVMVGAESVFQLGAVTPMSVSELPLALLLGAVAGLGGVLFNKGLVASLDFAERLKRSRWAAGAIAGGVVGLAGWLMPDLSGSGSVLADEAIAGRIALTILPLLLLSRFFLTLICYGSGAAGGIFGPLLVLGAMGGFYFASGAAGLFPGWLTNPQSFAVLGMGALMTAVVRAPLTGIVLMIEMTGEYDFMLPLLVSCLAAYGVAEWLGNPPIYHQLRQRAEKGAESDQTKVFS